MRKVISRLFGIECAHDHVLVVRSAGVTRSVCESCGHLSFTIEATPYQPFSVDEFIDTSLGQASGL